MDGLNFDDLNDFRFGMKVVCEFNVVSLFKVVGFIKEDIRKLLKELGFLIWDKFVFVCFFLCIFYGERIIKEKLSMIEKVEEYLFEFGFK